MNLRDQKIWLCWKKNGINPSNGKIKKRPVNPVTGLSAECNDPDTWVDYATAKAAVPSKYDGYGIALSAELGLVIVDFDSCRDPQTGVIKDWALEEIKKADSFTEISASGTGIHILAWGSIPENHGANASCDAEIYGSDHMFWLTGNVFDGHRTIETRDLTDLCKRIKEKTVGPKDPKQRAGAEKGGMIVRQPADKKKLMEGGWEENYGGDHSSADLALCNLLAREHAGDEDKIDTEFRKSCLMREKWEREDYRDRTIGKAVKSYEEWKKNQEQYATVKAPLTALVEQQLEKPTVDKLGEIRYPLEVWDGTGYAEFAEVCGKGNFVPREFFIEALKTYVGGIAGDNMLITNDRAGKPRFYTILLAGPGTGKNTAINWTYELFRVKDPALSASIWPPEALVWYPQHKMENSMYSKIGVCRMKISSATGLAKALPRLGKDGKICNSPQDRTMIVYTELTEMFEKLGIDGSGGALMSALCDLYDDEEFVVPALSDQDSFGGRLLMSMLAGIQPRRWDIICAGKGIEGSGFDERLNIIPTTNLKTVASLDDPDFSTFREPFLSRVMDLDKNPYQVQSTRGAKNYANELYQKMKPNDEDEDAPSAGRLQVLAWRNALHYAWLTGAQLIDEGIIERGMKLSKYQLDVRKAYKPLQGDNKTAQAANAIWRWMLKRQLGEEVKMRELARAVHASRLGPVFDSGLKFLSGHKKIVITDYHGDNGRVYQAIRRVE